MPPPRQLGSLLYLLALAAVLVRLPVVLTPFFDEDRAQLDYLLDAGDRQEAMPHPYSFRGWWDLYRFLDGDPAATGRRIEAGTLPWRTDPLEKIAYWRPVTSATMAVDAALFGISALPAHCHSFLWFLVLAASLLVFYRRLLPAGAATVAWLAFLVSPASVYALQWWTARNALLAALFAVWFLHFHLDWMVSGRRGRLLAALGCLALALLSAEAAAAVLAFALAHALIESRVETGSPGLGGALRRLSPALLLTSGWLALRATLGYGVSRSALYVDPMEEPAVVARLALDRLHRALGTTLLNQATGSLLILAALGVVLALLVVFYLRSGGEHRSTLAWLMLGTLVAVAPCLTSRNAARPWTLLIPQIGAHAILGLLVAWGWDRGGVRSIRTTRGLLATIVAVAALLVPLADHVAAAGRSRAMRRSRSLTSLAAAFPAATRQILGTDIDEIVFLASPWRILTPSRLVRWYGIELADPASVVSLIVTDRPVRARRVQRVDEATLAVSAEEGLLRRDDLFRFDRRYPLEPGFSVTGEGFEVEVEATSGPAVTALRLRLDRSLDDPGVVLLAWDGAVFRVVEPPPVGAGLSLAR